jgi:hypothetical protein
MKRRESRGTTTSSGAGRRRGRSRRLALVAIGAASACALLTASAAQASTVAIGSVLPLEYSSTKFEAVKTLLNTALPEKGANLVSPVSGAIVRWRVQGAAGGPFYLRVLRPNGAGAYTAVGTSGAATPSGPVLQTFTTNLPIQAGDTIGIDPTNASDEIGIATVEGASSAFIIPPPFEGSTVAPSGENPSGQEIELSAEVQPAPAIASIDPSQGSIAGGTTVTITGTNLNGATAVKFGPTPATSFTAESETQITAVAPPTPKPGAVDVTVTTVAGTSATRSGSDRFVYTACVVPKLKGKTLKRARKALVKAGCRLGKVKGHKTAAAKVTKQVPKPRKILPLGAKVNIKLAS